MRFGAIIKILTAFLLVVVVAVAIFLKSMDFNEYKGLLADQVKAATGRDLVIQGDFDLKLSLSPALMVNNLAFANAPWGSRPEMVKLERLEVVVDLLPLLSGDIQVQRLVLISPDILLETNDLGQGNWTFGKGEKANAPSERSVSSGNASIPLVNEIQIKNASLSYRDGATQKTQTLVLDSLVGRAANLDSPLELEISGSYNAQRIETKAKTGSVHQLLNPTAPFPLQLETRLNENILKADGTLQFPLEGKGLDLQFTAEGPTLAKLPKLSTEVDLPSLGPFHLTGRVTDPDGVYAIKDLNLKLGRSALSGDLSLRAGGTRPFLKADIASLNLEPDELHPQKEKREGEGNQGKAGSKEPKKDRVFSDDPLPLDGLRAIDAKITLAQGRVASSGVELVNMTLDMALDNGRLSIPTLKAEISTGGTLSANLSLNGQKPLAALKAAIQVKNLDLPPLLKKMEATNLLSAGKADLEMDLAGDGKSLRTLMAGLDGKISLIMGEGRIENKYMDFMAADLIHLILPGEAKKEYTAVNCFVCRFDIKDGLATNKGLLLDTEQMTVAGEGDINLADESLQLTMNPSPKEKALVSLAVPVHIRGTFLEPSVQPDAAAVVKGVAGAVLGTAVMGPIGLLAPLSKGGTGKTNPCLEALASKGTKASSQAKETAPAPTPPEQPAEKVKGILKGLGGLFK